MLIRVWFWRLEERKCLLSLRRTVKKMQRTMSHSASLPFFWSCVCIFIIFWVMRQREPSSDIVQKQQERSIHQKVLLPVSGGLKDWEMEQEEPGENQPRKMQSPHCWSGITPGTSVGWGLTPAQSKGGSLEKVTLGVQVDTKLAMGQ